MRCRWPLLCSGRMTTWSPPSPSWCGTRERSLSIWCPWSGPRPEGSRGCSAHRTREADIRPSQLRCELLGNPLVWQKDQKDQKDQKGESAMGLLDGINWQGSIFMGGAWVHGRGGDYAVVEPATGAELGRMGRATAEDVAEAGKVALEAQKEWAALPHTARAAVLRKAGDLWAEHAEEISGWNVREVGAVPGIAGFALHVAAEECYDCLLYTS